MKAKDKTTGKMIDVTPAFGGYFSCNGELIPQGDLEFNDYRLNEKFNYDEERAKTYNHVDDIILG